ncbi:MAG: Rrf2 family transcriptional regulator [Kiritimatiellaeota bacterium]|nr:Rrf2 family transcriptional regulator [Kiritimatiellota bacterium]
MQKKTKTTLAGRSAVKKAAAPAGKFGSGLNVTTKGRYGLRFMIALARHPGAEAFTLGALSRLLVISEKYLWHVARLLTSAELIRAERGAHGGYRLARQPEAITLLEIVEALEGPCQLVPADEFKNGAAGFAWREVETALRQKLQSLTLRDIVEQHDAQSAELHYVI